jgi:teichuronic acid biosynthesis glycosyltransferase TuaG
MPKISIVMPTYNQGDLLRRAIKSVLSQDFSDWELLVINNYSTDNTIQVVEEFSDSRIKYYNIQNQGVIALSRNLGISKAESDLIAFLDSDDYWFDTKLSECWNYIKKTNCDLVCHGESWEDLSGTVKKTVIYGPKTAATFVSLVFNRNCLSTSAVVAKKKILQNVDCFDINKECQMVEDYDLWIRLSKYNANIEFIDSILGVYTIHNSTSKKSLLRQMKSEIMLLNKYFRFFKSEGLNFFYIRCAKRIFRLFFSFSIRLINS